ncbi:MAG: sodium:solute symporter family protein [Vampirovibrionales bacterium]|nr:sodium:solute symporter family protein [Vampirovibrionales bacterium]
MSDIGLFPPSAMLAFLSVLVLGGLSLGVIGLSVWLSKLSKTLPDFFLAGKSLGLLPVACTFVASWFGAASTLATSQAVAQRGLNGLWDMAIPSVITCVAIATVMAKRVASMPGLSMPQAVEGFYGPVGRLGLACIVVVATTTLMAAQLVAAGQVLEALLGWPFWLTASGFALVVVSYSMVGGYWAVVATDMLQLLLIIVGLVIPLWVFGPPVAHFSTPQLAIRWGELTPTAAQLATAVTFVLGWMVAPEMWQRMTSLKNPNDAQPSVWLATATLAALFLLVTCLGFVGQHLLATSSMTSSGAATVWMAVAQGLNNPILSTFMVVGVACAIASTMDSSLNVASLTLVHDVLPRLRAIVNPTASPTVDFPLWVCRVATVVLMLPALWIAVSFQNIVHVLWLSADVYASAMAIPVVAMVVFPPNPHDIRAQQAFKKAGQWAMAGGASVVLVGRLITALPSPVNHYWPVWPWGTLIGIAVSVSLFAMVYGFDSNKNRAEAL